MSNDPEGRGPAQAPPELQKQSSSDKSAQIEPIVTPPPEDPVTPNPAVTRQRERMTLNQLRARLDPWLATINLGIAILGFVVIVLQSLIYIQQKDIMNQQSQLMEKSFRVSERAYVGVEKITANLENREILITLQNIGHIPAAAVKLQGQHIRGTQKEKDPRGAVFRWEAGAVELFPGTPMPVAVYLENVEQSDLDAISNKTKNLYIGGTIQYDDGFGNIEKTTFAFQYDPPPQNRWIAHSDLSRIFKDIGAN